MFAYRIGIDGPDVDGWKALPGRSWNHREGRRGGKQKGKSEQLAESLRSVTNSWSVKTKVSEGQLSGLRQILIGISERLIAS